MSTRSENFAVDELTLEDHLDPDERELEASPEDVAEQAALADPAAAQETVAQETLVEEPEALVDGEASEWDALEQSRVVELDDEYDR